MLFISLTAHRDTSLLDDGTLLFAMHLHNTWSPQELLLGLWSKHCAISVKPQCQP